MAISLSVIVCGCDWRSQEPCCLLYLCQEGCISGFQTLHAFFGTPHCVGSQASCSKMLAVASNSVTGCQTNQELRCRACSVPHLPGSWCFIQFLPTPLLGKGFRLHQREPFCPKQFSSGVSRSSTVLPSTPLLVFFIIVRRKNK